MQNKAKKKKTEISNFVIDLDKFEKRKEYFFLIQKLQVIMHASIMESRIYINISRYVLFCIRKYKEL